MTHAHLPQPHGQGRRRSAMGAEAKRAARADGDAGEPKRGDGEALRREVLERTRIALARVQAVRGALERLLEALGAGEESALRKSTEELSVRRRAQAGVLLDAQELADRAVDSMSSR